ncbi:MAG: DNA repair protein RadA [Candidatus Melainabacteria bacterium RIFCSPHIGHO2_02_FULL_34_12]|nr:MAG: DNA repair protein RadA [Candidatus Melainabacteria bacterium RIFCSPHIGHO2_02_FULL_34_12]
MPKISSKWTCQECGYISPSYIGKCPECNSWNSLIEEIVSKKSSYLRTNEKDNSFSLCSDINISEMNRIKSFDSELDNVLGGGFVSGSLILLSGEPGIGKSTLLLQVADHLSKNHKVAYVTAEESLHQVKLRGDRLNLSGKNLLLLSENNLEQIISLIEKEKPGFLIIDSIQAIYHPELESTGGSVSQVRECANKLLRLAKENNITTLMAGHVNKEGMIAGPKVLEHIVDTVLYFEGEKFHNFRILRATKNRFGCTDEIAVFEMKEHGLKTIPNPSFLFMSQNKDSVPGSTYAALVEGSKTIIAEIQALVGGTSYTTPRRVANGLDYNRVLQIIAILERRVGFNFSKHDMFVNLVGGLSSYEPALDLSIAMSIVSCKQDVIPVKKTIYVGEVGLTGEIRQVNQIENRIKEAVKLGFERIVIPSGCDISKSLQSKIEIIESKKILDAIRATLAQAQSI